MKNTKINDQLTEIIVEDYSETRNEEDIVFPKLAEEITRRKLTFDRFCEKAGLDIDKFGAALTGEREFVQWEIVAIRTALQLTADQTIAIFFPEFAARRYATCTEMLKMCANIGMTVDEYADELVRI